MTGKSALHFGPGDIVVVVGVGRSGLAAARLLTRCGVSVRLVDRREPEAPLYEKLRCEAQENGWVLVFGEHRHEHFADACGVVVSPGVPLGRVETFLPPSRPFVTGELELAARFVTEPILAVTGTSGKTTTVSVATAMLQAAGKTVFLGGNIGTPLSEYVLGRDSGKIPKADVVVLETSSFQLQTCVAFHPHVAMLLNLSPNHLDHHRDMAEYTSAKFRIFAQQTSEDIAVFPECLREEAKRHSVRGSCRFYTDTGSFVHTELLGRHNRLNLEAAWAAVQPFGVTLEQAQAAALSFKPLPNRLERVAEKNGILFVNDSKSTTVEALRVALESLADAGRPVVLLAGGKFKGGDLSTLRPLLVKDARAVTLYGGFREAFEQGFAGTVPVTWNETMDAALLQAVEFAQPGDVILLSPATASFDQYKNYEERGEHFRDLVRRL